MRDQDHSLVQLLLQRSELTLKSSPCDRIKCAKRLVHEKERRISGQRARHADPLTLPARKLARKTAAKVSRLEADKAKQLFNPSVNAIVRPALEPRNHRDVALNTEMREQSAFLDHVAGSAAQADRIPDASRAVLYENFSFARLEQAVDELQRRGFAGAAAAEKNQRLPAVER